ncbi:MAG TPA: aldose epimerase family protein, partial [Vicinamibacteria bacterium]|nr:aldose epimerase family protein [Vicinamibacteria bacterium]
SRFFGVVVGRYANRIAHARFTLDGRTHALTPNEPPHHLHGGLRGLHKAVWRGEASGEAAVTFRCSSPDGDEGYPGNLEASVTYTLTGAGEVVIDYEATSDRPTPVNLSQHSYFNLAGEGRGDVLGHRLVIDADHFTPVDATMIPTGEIAPVAGTPFDFRVPAAVGARIDEDHEQLRRGLGYDHNFVLRRGGPGLARAARVADPASRRWMEVHTTEPGVQLYSGNRLDGVVGKSGHAYSPRTGFCLETQHFPDSPNRPEFPSTILRPGEVYRSRTVWAFGVD